MTRSGFAFVLVLGALALGVPAMGAPRAAELPPYRVVDGRSIPAPLTDTPGDPARGRQIAVDRTRGNCLACHALPVPERLQGNVGPDLAGVAGRLSPGEIRLRIVNPRAANPDTTMPAYFRVDGLYRVRADMVGRPVLTAAEIEDLIAYLATLRP